MADNAGEGSNVAYLLQGKISTNITDQFGAGVDLGVNPHAVLIMARDYVSEFILYFNEVVPLGAGFQSKFLRLRNGLKPRGLGLSWLNNALYKFRRSLALLTSSNVLFG